MNILEYDKPYNSYMDYVNKCRFMIKNTFFSEKDTFDLNIKNKDNLELTKIIRNHRLKMIDIKLNHTMRMIERVVNVNEALGFKIDFSLIIKISVLYHDIGRIRQSTWSNTFNDRRYKEINMPFKNHAEDGYNIFMNNDFGIDDIYVPLIGETILHHQEPHIIENLHHMCNDSLDNITIDDIVTGNFELNESEWQIATLITQLVADMDRVDILYQYLTGDLVLIKDYVSDNSMDTLENIAKRWGISKSEIIEYNKIDENNYKPTKIKVPIKNISIDRLEVPSYIKEMFYNNSWPELKDIAQDKNWNFITMFWWRISHFLNQTTFTSVLINIEESKLLDQIYNKIPEEYKPLFSEAIEYAKEVLLHKRISENKGKVYLKKM